MKENSFTFVPTFYSDLKELPYETRCKVIDALCYWGVYRELPQEVNGDAIIRALLANPQRMIEGQAVYKEKAAEIGKKGGVTPKISDEQILGVYFDFRKQGIKPTEQQVIDKCGGGVQRIARRDVWKNKEKLWYEHCINENDTIDTNVSMDVYKDTNDLYNDIHNVNKIDTNDTQENKPRLFDF